MYLLQIISDMRYFMKKIYILWLICLMILLSACAKTTSLNFNSYLDELFISFIGDDPMMVNATLYNTNQYELNELEVKAVSLSEQQEKEMFSDYKSIITKLNKFNNNNLREEDILTKDILIDYLERELNFEGLYYYSTALGSYLGYQAQLPMILAEYRFDDEKDVKDYFAYLETTKASFKTIIQYEYEKYELGIGLNTQIINRVMAQCDELIVSEASFLIPTFNNRIDKLALSNTKKEELKAKNILLVKQNFLGAYKYLKSELKKLAMLSDDRFIVDEGRKDYYEALFQKATGVDSDIPEVISYLDKLLNDLSKRKLAHGGTYEIVSSNYDLVEDRGFEDIIPFFISEMKVDFPKVEDSQYEIKEIHDSMTEFSSPAMYFISPIDYNQKEVIYINPLNFKTTNNYVYQTLAHEAYPGHLYQNLYLKNREIHDIRKILDYPGYAEGWATYVENYVVKYAGANDYIQDILMIHNSFAYVILGRVDIGINYEGWNIEECERFLGKYFNLDTIDVEDIYYDMLEVPTNYLQYYYSYYQIIDLQEDFKEMMGNEYSDYLFHKIYLDTGPASFAILALEYQKYQEKVLK